MGHADTLSDEFMFANPNPEDFGEVHSSHVQLETIGDETEQPFPPLASPSRKKQGGQFSLSPSSPSGTPQFGPSFRLITHEESAVLPTV
jgi:hypothetical protein